MRRIFFFFFWSEERGNVEQVSLVKTKQKHPSFLGEIKSSPSESPLMEKKNSLKEDREETKLSLSDTETRNPVSEVGSAATGPLRAAVEERTVSFKLGDLEEAPERERLPSVDLKEETSIDGTMNGEWTLLGWGKASFPLSAALLRGSVFGLDALGIECNLSVLARCSAAA